MDYEQPKIQKYRKNEGPRRTTTKRQLDSTKRKQLVKERVFVDVGYDGKEKVDVKTEYSTDKREEESSDDEESSGHDHASGGEQEDDAQSTSSSLYSSDDEEPGDDLHADQDDLFMNEVNVNTEEMMTIEYLCKTNPLAQSAMSFLVNNLKAGGLEVTMDVLGVRNQLSEEHQKVFDIEWAGQFLEELIWSFMTLGFAVVNLVPSNVKKGEMVPMVIPQSCYMLTFVERFGQRREYRVYPMDQGTNYDEYLRRKQKKGKTELDPDRNVSVYVMYPPLSNGDLTSPFSALYERLVQLEWSWENFAAADYSASHPIPAVQTTAKDNKPEPNETANIGENQLGLYLHEQKAKLDDQDRDEIQASVEASYKLQKTIMARRMATGLTGRYGVNPNALSSPYENVFIPGVGREVKDTPRPTHNPLLETVNHLVAAIVASVLGIPSQFLAAEQVMHAANAELNLRLFDKTAKAYQQKIQPILQDLFEKSYRDAHREFRNAAYKEIKENRKRARDGKEVQKAMDREEDKAEPTKKKIGTEKPPSDAKDLLSTKRPAGDTSELGKEAVKGKPAKKSRLDADGKEKGEQEKKEDDEEDGSAKGAKEHDVGESVQRFIKSTGEPAQAGLDRKSLEQGDRIAVSKVVGRDATLNEHGRPKRSKFGFSKPPVSIDDKRMKELIKKNISFKIAFKRTPLTDVASLEHAYNVANIIDYDEYAQGLANVIGLDEHRILTEEESAQQGEKKMKLQSDNMMKYAPPEEQGAGGAKKPGAPSGGGGAPSASGAKKPAAASASPTAVSSNLKKQGEKAK